MPTYKPLDWYEQAEYYDIIFDTDTVEEADFLEDVFEKHVLSKGHRILEPACGSGRLVRELADRGYSVTGFDLSDGMLRFARESAEKRGVKAKLFKAPMEDFKVTGKFDFAHNMVSTFKYLQSDADAEKHLRCVAEALRPGGVYVVGLHLDDYDNDQRGRERWTGSRNGTHVVCNIQGWPSDRRTRKAKLRSRLIVTRNGHTDYYESYWQFHCYSFRQLKQLLRCVRDVFEHVATYDFNCDIDEPIAFDGEIGDTMLVLRRR